MLKFEGWEEVWRIEAVQLNRVTVFIFRDYSHKRNLGVLPCSEKKFKSNNIISEDQHGNTKGFDHTEKR
jgi:hypothetical protein